MCVFNFTTSTRLFSKVVMTVYTDIKDETFWLFYISSTRGIIKLFHFFSQSGWCAVAFHCYFNYLSLTVNDIEFVIFIGII